MQSNGLGLVVCGTALFVTTMMALAADRTVTAAQPILSGEFRYLNAQRISYFQVRNGTATVGELLPLKSSPDGKSRPPSEILGANIYDCSDTSYLCLKFARNVFAVPRTTLSSHMTYIVAGTEFSVKECYRESGNVCEAALISADCHLMIEGDNCTSLPGGRQKSSRPGPLAYFIFNADYGITSFGFLDMVARNVVEMKLVASDFVLQGDRGLLSRR